MSHCPDPYTARREGRRARENGRGLFSNPHADDCEEAQRAWRRGWYAADEEQEERDDEARRRAAEDLREAQDSEEMAGSACGPGCGWCGRCL